MVLFHLLAPGSLPASHRGLLKAAPVVGEVISGISVAEDLYGTYKAVGGCHP